MGIFPVEVDLNILVVQENYSGGKSMATVFFLYANSSIETVPYFSLCYVGLRVSVHSKYHLTDYYSCRDIFIQYLSCFPLSKSV